jgi:hypothetical protein
MCEYYRGGIRFVQGFTLNHQDKVGHRRANRFVDEADRLGEDSLFSSSGNGRAIG